MRTNFERVGLMLDAMQSGLSPTEVTAIGSSAAALKASYRGLTRPDLPPIDYSNAATQFAYLYTYTPANADLIYRTLTQAREVTAPALDRQTVRISAFGGGPGSELLGCYK